VQVDDEQRDVTLTSADASQGGDRLRVLGRGEVVGRYMVLDRVGEGGMGVVYAAYDPELDRKLALKLLHHASGERAAQRRHRLMREAQAMARLSHRNVIAVHDVGTIDEHVFVAMEFIEGGSMRGWLAERREAGTLDWRATLAIAIDAGRGLAAAHAAGLVHRDFKPDNVMISREGRVVVTDFGLARAAGNGEESGRVDPSGSDVQGLPATSINRGRLSATVTAVGAIMGTPAYMAPEQHLGHGADERSDQFSFAVATWEALYGTRPFAGDDIASLAYHVTSGNLREPPARSPVPTWVARALARALALESERRYPTMDALLHELTRDRTWRPRWWGLAASVGAAAAIGLYAGFVLDPEPEPCGAGKRQARQVWNGDREERLRARYVDSGLGYAAEQWPAVRGELTRYIDDWTVAYEDACRATHIRGDQSEAVLDARMGCLGRRLEEFSALVDVLERAEPAVIQRSLEAAQGLPRLRACSHLETLLDPVPLADDPKIATEVERLRPELARVAALHRAGLFEVGLAEARDLERAARDLGYDPLLAEALLTLGDYEVSRAILDDAERHLREAVVVAVRGRSDRVAAHAAVELVDVLASDPLRSMEADGWAELASSLLVRTGGDPELEVMLAGRRAMVAKARGDLMAARAQLLRVMEVHERAHGPTDVRVADAAVALAEVQAALGDAPAAGALLERALEIDEFAVGLDHPRTATVLVRLAALGRTRGDFAGAFERLDRAIGVIELAFGRDAVELVEPLVEAGRNLVDIGRPSEAVPILERARALAQLHHLPDETIAAIAISQADAALGTGQPASAMEHLALARLPLTDADAPARAEASPGPRSDTSQRLRPDPRLLAATVEVLAAEALLELDRVEDAALRLRPAASVLDAPGAEPSPATIRMLVALGRAEARMQSPVLAADAFGRAITLVDRAVATPPWVRGRAQLELARILWNDEDNREHARELLRSAGRVPKSDDARIRSLREDVAASMSIHSD
jgi:tetratricopeptide (TPR) repeat protein